MTQAKSKAKAKPKPKLKREKYVAEFTLDTTTPGAARFKEDEDDRDKAMIRTQYIRKPLWEDFATCEGIRVTIEPIFR